MLSRVKIKTGFTLIFVLLTLFLISISIISLNALRESKTSIHKVDTIQGRQIIPLYNIHSDLLSARILGHKIANSLESTPEKDISELLDEQSKYIKSAMSEMDKLHNQKALTTEGRKLRAAIDASFSQYTKNGIIPMHESLSAKDLKSYREISITDMSSDGAKFREDLVAFTNFATRVGREEVDASVKTYNVNVIAISLALILSLAIVTASIYFIKLALFAYIQKAKEYFSLIEKGDLSFSISPQKNTEMGGLLTSLSNMQVSLTNLVSTIGESSVKIAIEASQLAEGNHNLSSRTEEQSASIVETAASMEQLTSSVKQNTENTRSATLMTDAMSKIAEKNNDNINRVINHIESIEENSGEISNILGVIDSIAFQTNILALNAAVEAARAGEAGRGFAVVASEVRSLAQRSAASAKEIKQVIERSGEKISQGSAIAKSSGRDMGTLLAEVRNIRELISGISLASEEQSQGISQVNIAVSQLERVSQQNAVLVDESSAATDMVASQAENLKNTLEFFTLKQGAT